MNDVAQPTNLVALAKGTPEGAILPGTNLEVSVIEKMAATELEQALWLMVLEGELIIDLPHGDFRILKVGESLHLPAGLKISFEPLEDVVALKQYL